MATPGYTFFELTSDPIINATTHGYRWVLGPDRTLDWSVSGGLLGEYWLNPSAVASEIANILSTFSYVANIKFNYVGSYTTPYAAAAAGAELNVSLSAFGTFPGPNVWAVAYFNPNFISYSGQIGDVFLNQASQANYLPSYFPGTTGWALFTHELGHALGLKHPHDDGSTGRPELGQIGLSAFDHDWGTIMSYNDDYDWNLLQWHPVTPMLLDVLALQYLYGPNTTVNAGDTTHQLARIDAYGTLWDPSGNDTVSAAGCSEGWYIELPDYQLSSLVSTLGGVAMPVIDAHLSTPTTLFWLAGTMENAIGSNFADEVFGSAGDNWLAGAGGNDLLSGGAGLDWAYYYGSINRFTVTKSGQDYIVTDRTGAEGSDFVTGMEALYFADKSMSLGVKALSTTIPGATLQSIVELYVAFFNRVPDSEGMAYWIGQAAAGVSIPTIANSFYGAAVQYSTLTGYSAGMTNADFVNVIYRNVLGRSSADAGGLAYWTGALANGSETRGTLVKSILDSAHTFKGNATYGWVADLLDNKYAVGKLFSVDMGLSFNTPQESISEGMRIAAAVTPFDTSAAISLIGVAPADIHLG